MASWHLDDAVVPRDLNNILEKNLKRYYLGIKVPFSSFYTCRLHSVKLPWMRASWPEPGTTANTPNHLHDRLYYLLQPSSHVSTSLHISHIRAMLLSANSHVSKSINLYIARIRARSFLSEPGQARIREILKHACVSGPLTPFLRDGPLSRTHRNKWPAHCPFRTSPQTSIWGLEGALQCLIAAC